MKKEEHNVKTFLKHDVPVGPRMEPESAGELVQRATVITESPQSSADEALQKIEEFLAKAAGVHDGKLARLLVNQMSVMQVWCSAEDRVQRLHQAAAVLREMDPKNATEAMLAVQMFGVHNAAVMFLQRATAQGQSFEGADANVLRASRLLRLFNEQLEAMAKLKGKTGQHKVTVEHVHVHSGGQAVVGVVEPSKRGERT